MADQQTSPETTGKDTSPLEWNQLSDAEFATILEIERRLYEVQESELPEDPLKDTFHYLAVPQRRDPRVLLLDGGRGTGKTTLLLTLVKRWHDEKRREIARKDNYKVRIERVRKSPGFAQGEHDFDIPDHVRVLPIIDFDPLPPGMPLMAGIVQAWKPLAERYDLLSGKLEDCDSKEQTLMDQWHRLFQVAAVGWTAIPGGRGLIEQILDREEQVQDWQRLGEHWQSFVNQVVKDGKCLKSPDNLVAKPVFVIMIDDVDLQIERVRELLPALRMLYHPRVVFLVAADRYHLVEMLKLDFLGQQNKAANRQLVSSKPRETSGMFQDALKGDDRDEWPEVLAESSFEKVFSLRNRWKVSPLSLDELLGFPHGQTETLGTVLDKWPQQDSKTGNFGSLGEYLRKMAGPLEDPVELPLIMPYRAANQIFEQARGRGDLKVKAMKAICQIIGRADTDYLLKITKPSEPGGPVSNIEYRATGELAALFGKGLAEPIGYDGEVVLSAHPDFIYFHGYGRSRELVPKLGSTYDGADYTSPLIAASLRDDGYGVVAVGLQWNIYLALAWTNVRLEETDLNLDLAFRWQLHEHPSPLRLLNWTREWRDFIHKLSGNTELRLQRIAYGWIYHQLRWMSKGSLAPDSATGSTPSGSGKIDGLRKPFSAEFNEPDSWSELLSQEPETGTDVEISRWKSRTLPLMARPELGLPVEVQQYLLKQPLEIPWLRDQRVRLVTDAIVAAGYLKGSPPKDAEVEERVKRATNVFEERHRKTYNEHSPWETAVGVSARSEPALDKK